MPPLPMMMLQPDRSSQPSSHFAKRNEAVAVTAPTLRLPSGSIEAAGEQWKLTRPSFSREAGMPEAVLDRTLVGAFARRKHAPAEIGDRADFERAQRVGACRQIERHSLEARTRHGLFRSLCERPFPFH